MNRRRCAYTEAVIPLEHALGSWDPEIPFIDNSKLVSKTLIVLFPGPVFLRAVLPFESSALDGGRSWNLECLVST